MERKKLGGGSESIKSSQNPLERMEWPMPPAQIGKRQMTVQFEENLQKRCEFNLNFMHQNRIKKLLGNILD